MSEQIVWYLIVVQPKIPKNMVTANKYEAYSPNKVQNGIFLHKYDKSNAVKG
jgi:hypothetical protein